MSDNVIEKGSQEPKVTKRWLLTVGGLGLLAKIIPGCSRPSEAQTTNPESFSSSIGRPYLDVKKTTGETKFSIVNKPIVVDTEFVPCADSTVGYKVFVFRDAEEKDGEPISPDKIQAKTAARILGNKHTFGEYKDILAKDAEGGSHSGGEWFVLMDKDGRLTNLAGNPLSENEQPYFFVSGQVDIVPKTPPTKTP